MEYINRIRSRSRSNSRSRKCSRRSRSRRSSQSRSRSRSLSRRSARRSHSKLTKNKSRLSRSRSRSFSRQKRSRSSCSRSSSRVRKFRSRSRSRSKSRSFKSRLSRSRSRSISRHRKSRSRSKSRYKKSRSRSRSKSRSKKRKLSRSRSNSRFRKSRSKSVSKTRYKKSRSSRSRSTSRKIQSKSSRSRSRSTQRKGFKELPKRRSKLRSASPSRRNNNDEIPSVIKKETDKRKWISSLKECDNKSDKKDDDDDDLLEIQEIPVGPKTPPPIFDVSSSDEEEQKKEKKAEEQIKEKHAGSQESSSNKDEMRIPLNFFDKNSTFENISSIKFNEADPLRALNKVDSSNDLLMPLTFGRKQPQTCVPSLQHQTVDLTENTDLRPSDIRLSNMRPSVYDMEDEISVGETTIDLNLGKTSFINTEFRENNRVKLVLDNECEGIIESNGESSLLDKTRKLTPLKSNIDNTEVVLDKAPVTRNINVTEDLNVNVKKRTAGQCGAAYLREGEILSTLRILHEMGREMGIWQDPISALYNQLSQLQTEGGDPRKYLNQNKDAYDTLNLIKGYLETILEDSKLGAVQRVVRQELLHLISDIIDGKSSHAPVECLTCYGLRIDVLACSMLHEDPEVIKEFIHNTLIYEGNYDPTYENISTIFKKVENFQKRFHHVEHPKEICHQGESVKVGN